MSKQLSPNSFLTVYRTGANKPSWDLGYCSLSPSLITYITNKSKYNKVTSLDLCSTDLSADGVKAVSTMLATNSSITYLNMDSNSIDSNGAVDIALALGSNNSLTKLALPHNRIFDDGVQALAVALETNHYIKILNIGYNKISAAGALHISNMLIHNDAIINLDIRGNSIGDEGIKAIAEALKANHFIERINLSNCDIGNEGAKALSSMITVNHVIKVLDLQSNHITLTGIKYLSKALMSNQVILSMNMNYNIDLVGQESHPNILYSIHRNKKLIQDLATFITNFTSTDFNNLDLDYNVKFIVSNIKYFKAFQVVDQSELWSCLAKTLSKETIQNLLDNISKLILKSFGLDNHIPVQEVANIIHEFVGPDSLWPWTEPSDITLTGNHQSECCLLF
jgi:hypothetical protein